VAESGEALIIPDAYKDPRFDPDFDKRTGFHTRSILCLPLAKGDGEILGVIQLLNKQGDQFTSDDADYLEALAAHMVIAIENAKAHMERIEQERTRKELQLAAEIQQRFLPQSKPELPGLKLEARAVPCHAVGGDYHDFLWLPGGGLGIVIADVAGKGIPAALITTAIHAYLHALITDYEGPSALATRLNELLHRSTIASKYVTMAFVEIDPELNRLVYCNCGHNPLLLIRDGRPEQLEANGTIVGMFPAAGFGESEIKLEGGERLLLYTDGVTEAAFGEDDDREEFGLQRLVDVCTRSSDDPASLLATVEREVENFTGGRPLDDDLTMIALELGKPEGGGK
jgi:sigma-B regulation protein RsbU (phosphoserine phosphatase)